MKKADAMMQKMAGAAKTAFDRVASVTGNDESPDVRVYKRLKENDFQVIADRYGAEATVDYIRKMEARSMMGGNKNGR